MSSSLAGGLAAAISHLDALSPVLSALRGEGRTDALMEAVRIVPIDVGQSVALSGGAGRDCLHVITGRATVTLPGADPFTLTAERSRVCPCSLPRDGAPITVQAEEPTVLCHIDREKLDFLIVWQELERNFTGGDQDLARRMRKIQSSPVFQRLPAASLAEAVRRMDAVVVTAGEEVVRQGESGEWFYIIDEGRAEVWREEFPGDDPQRVTEIGEGEGFGEEALVTGKTRSATVRMITDGRLLRLGKEDFHALVSRPLIREVSPQVAKALVDDGHRLLDVRYEEEFDESYLPGTTLIPLTELRQRTDELPRDVPYVVYCRSGKRSAVGALVLSQRGFEAVSLAGGILDWPYEVRSNLPPPPPR